MTSVYWQYVKAGKLRWWCLLVISFVAFRVTKVVYFWYLKEWGERYGEPEPDMLTMAFGGDARQNNLLRPILQRATAAASGNDWLDFGKYLPSPQVNVRPWLFWFLVISMVQVLTQLLSEFVLLAIMYEAAKKLFQDAMRRVSGASFRFYAVTPV